MGPGALSLLVEGEGQAVAVGPHLMFRCAPSHKCALSPRAEPPNF